MVSIHLYSMKKGEIANFLKRFYEKDIVSDDILQWSKEFENPIEIADIIGSFIDNDEKFEINMWTSLDEGFLLRVSEDNVDSIIRYLYERFPY